MWLLSLNSLIYLLWCAGGHTPPQASWESTVINSYLCVRYGGKKDKKWHHFRTSVALFVIALHEPALSFFPSFTAGNFCCPLVSKNPLIYNLVGLNLLTQTHAEWFVKCTKQFLGSHKESEPFCSSLLIYLYQEHRSLWVWAGYRSLVLTHTFVNLKCLQLKEIYLSHLLILLLDFNQNHLHWCHSRDFISLLKHTIYPHLYHLPPPPHLNGLLYQGRLMSPSSALI